MTRLHKISLKFLPAFTAVLVFCALTWNCKPRHITQREIYSTLTKDTSGTQKKDVLFQKPMPAQPSGVDTTKPAISDTTGARVVDFKDSLSAADSISAITDSTLNDTALVQRADTFALKLSKDSLDAPVNYEAEDSAVVLVADKKILLYGKTKTVYKDITLQSPKVELDQQTNLVTAYNSRDSLGEVAERARFEQGENKFESDTIKFNFKTQKGLTTNTFTQQNEMFVQGEAIKKVTPNTFFVRRGRFTTCNLDHPHFAFVSNKIKVINNKVAVSGPTHPEFEDVPVPLYLPFGYFPLSRGRHSGLLQATFITSEDFGLGLTGLGYYKVLNDNIDVTLRGDIYSYGGWNANLSTSYRKRYRYDGGFNLAVQHTKLNFKGDPDYTASNNFQITWSHRVDPRARPGTSFSANVNAGSTQFNKYQLAQPNVNFQNKLYSSIAYSKTWTGKPYNLTLSANHNQDMYTRDIFLLLPDAGFTVSTLYPFQQQDAAGTSKWYEKLGIGYNGVARNQLAFNDSSKKTLRQLFDTLQWGAQHRIPITLSLPSLGPLQISPSVSYEETWLTRRTHRSWDRAQNKIDTITTQRGLFIDRHMSFSMSLTTALFGTAQFRRSRLAALRHVMRPNVSFNYVPNLSKKFYDVVQMDSSGRRQALSQFDDNMFSGYSYGTFGGISFGIDNNLEGKWRSKRDTSAGGIKKIRLIDGFGFTSGYNFLADSLKLLPFSISLRSSLFEKINLNASVILDPYQTDLKGQNVDRFAWANGRFSPGRIRSGSISLSTNFQSKPRDEEKAKETEEEQEITQITDPTLLGDQERLMDYMRRNPAEFVDFNIPWTLNLGFSLSFGERRQPDYTFVTDYSASLNFNGDFSLTPKWKFGANGFLDMETRQIQNFNMSINREMHCWQMAISVTPIGQWRYFSFTISPKSGMLQDLKVNRTRTFYSY
jgi:LPS-assembly protein